MNFNTSKGLMRRPTLPSVGKVRFRKLDDLVIHGFDVNQFRLNDLTAGKVEREMHRLRKLADATKLFN